MPKPEGSTQENAQEGTLENQEGQVQEGQQQTDQQAQQQIDWENEQNPYRKRYTDSQSQIQPLVRTLQQFAEYDHSTKSWKPKTQVVSQPQNSDFEKILEGYDPEFKKAMFGYTQKQITEALNAYKQESAFLSEYNSGVLNSRSKAMEEFGEEFDFAKNGKMNTASPLYQLANEIVTSKYAVFNPDGTFLKYNSPDAEYLATCEAYAILARRSKQQTQNKAPLNAIKGKGTGSAAVKRNLSYEEYKNLPTDADRDAYDLAQLEAR